MFPTLSSAVSTHRQLSRDRLNRPGLSKEPGRFVPDHIGVFPDINESLEDAWLFMPASCAICAGLPGRQRPTSTTGAFRSARGRRAWTLSLAASCNPKEEEWPLRWQLMSTTIWRG